MDRTLFTKTVLVIPQRFGIVGRELALGLETLVNVLPDCAVCTICSNDD
jgi:hypothetical protein